LYDDADYMACCRLPKPESLVICGAAYLKSDPEITLRLQVIENKKLSEWQAMCFQTLNPP
jgi:hypothetical protein